MLDTDANPCQSAHITVPVSSNGETDAGLFVQYTGETKPSHGGVRPGSGRPKLNPVDPWDALGISKATYYRRLKPIISTQISYVVDAPRWYCVRTEYGAENHADHAIRTAGFQTFYPLLWVASVAAQRTADGRAIPAKAERLAPLLPRYLFVNFDRSNPSWRDICTMRGVERVFSTHPERPTPIPDRDIARLREGLAPNNTLYPPKAAETATGGKKRWVDMATALLALVGVE